MREQGRSSTGIASLQAVKIVAYDSETDKAIPDNDDDIASLASQSFASLQPSSLQLPASALTGAVCFRLAMIFPGDFVSQFVPRGFASPGDLELTTLRWSLPGPLFQSSWNAPTRVTLLLIDLCSSFGSLLHVLLALGCRCVAVCVEHNEEFAEVAQASFPQSVHLEFVDKLDPEAFVGVLSRRSFNLVLAREVRRVKATLSGAQMYPILRSITSVGLPVETCIRVQKSTEK